MLKKIIVKKQRVSTSLKLERNTWKRAKIQAIIEDIELSELVEKCINRWLKLSGKEQNKFLKKYRKFPNQA